MIDFLVCARSAQISSVSRNYLALASVESQPRSSPSQVLAALMAPSDLSCHFVTSKSLVWSLNLPCNLLEPIQTAPAQHFNDQSARRLVSPIHYLLHTSENPNVRHMVAMCCVHLANGIVCIHTNTSRLYIYIERERTRETKRVGY